MSLNLFGEVGGQAPPSESASVDLFGAPTAPPVAVSTATSASNTSDIFGSLTDSSTVQPPRGKSADIPKRTNAELVELLKNGAASASPTPESFPLTDEQEDIKAAFLRGEDMVISAGAGTGKTSTLVALSEALYADDHLTSGIYITFNKSMAEEVGDKFTYANIEGRTTHSLAYRGAMRTPHIAALLPRLNTKTRPPRHDQVVRQYGVSALEIMDRKASTAHIAVTSAVVKPTSLVIMAYDAIDKFCQSADDEIGPRHVIVDMEVRRRGADVVEDVQSRVSALAKKMWDGDICSPTGVLRFKHDYYLKLFCLTEPDIASWFRGGNRRPVLFFDEAQDGRPVLTKLIMDQRPRMQVVMCGDSSQAIYGFLGCVDALRKFKEYKDVSSYTLTQTFRFGPAIARLANSVLNVIPGSDVRLVPNMEITSACITTIPDNFCSVDAVLCRTNTEVIEIVCDLFLAGRMVYTTADTDRTLRIANDLLRISNGERPTSTEMKFIRNQEHLVDLLSKHSAPDRFEDPDMDSVSSTAGGGDTPFDDIVGLISWMRKRGIKNIIEALTYGLSPAEETADITVSTIHKSKGRQWDAVAIPAIDRLIPNAPHVVNRRSTSGSGWAKLLYVAITRARKALYVPEAIRELWITTTPLPKRKSVDLVEGSDEWWSLLFHGLGVYNAALDGPVPEGITPSKIAQTMIAVCDMFLYESDNADRWDYLSEIFSAVKLGSLVEVVELAKEHSLPRGMCAEMFSPREADEWEFSSAKRLLDGTE